MSNDKVKFSFAEQIMVSIVTSIILTSILLKEIEKNNKK